MTKFGLLLIGASLLMCLAGCQSLKPMSLNPLEMFASEKEKEANPGVDLTRPVKLVAIWKDATLPGPNGKMIRGFAGRVYFFDAKDMPVKVDGEFVVYGFDDSREENSKDEPDKKFVFPPESLAPKHSVSDVGSSYSMWLPWDEVGGERKSITLISMYRSAAGLTLRGEPTVGMLPGTKPLLQSERDEFMKHYRSSVKEGVSPASFEQISKSSDSKKIRTTSIPLSQNLRERLNQNQTAPALENDADAWEKDDARLPDAQFIPSSVPDDDKGHVSKAAMSQNTVSPISSTMPTTQDRGSERKPNSFNRIPVTPIGG